MARKKTGRSQPVSEKEAGEKSTAGDAVAGLLDGAAAPATNTLVDVFTPDGADALKQVTDALDGHPITDDLFDVLKAGGVDSRATMDGESVIGAAMNETAFLAKLEEHGCLTITDGRIAVSSS